MDQKSPESRWRLRVAASLGRHAESKRPPDWDASRLRQRLTTQASSSDVDALALALAREGLPLLVDLVAPMYWSELQGRANLKGAAAPDADHWRELLSSNWSRLAGWSPHDWEYWAHRWLLTLTAPERPWSSAGSRLPTLDPVLPALLGGGSH